MLARAEKWGIMQALWPVEHHTFATDLSTAEVLCRLGQAIGTPTVRSALLNWPTGPARFGGRIQGARFDFLERSFLMVPYRPILKGLVTATSSGQAIIDVLVRPQLPELIGLLALSVAGFTVCFWCPLVFAAGYHLLGCVTGFGMGKERFLEAFKQLVNVGR